MAPSGLPPSNARAALARDASERAASSVASAAKWISARTAFDAGSVASCIEIVWIEVRDGAQLRYGACVVTLVRQLTRRHVFRRRVARQMRLEERANLRQRLGADEFIDDASAAKQLHGGNAADVKLLREILVLVGVHLDDFYLAGIFIGQLFEHGSERAAWATPRRPEVDQHGLRGRGVDDLGGEGCRGYGGYGCSHGPAIGTQAG